MTATEGGTKTRARQRPSSAELCTPRTFVVATDFVPLWPDVNALAERYAAELDQRAAACSGHVTPTLIAILSVLEVLPLDIGFQVPKNFLAKLIGRDRSTIYDAINLGTELGLLRAYAPVRKVVNITHGRITHARTKEAGGRWSSRDTIHTHGVLYRTVKGRAWIHRNESTTRSYLRGQTGRKQVELGLVRYLRKTLSPLIRLTARRCARNPSHPTPKATTLPLVIFNSSRGTEVVGNSTSDPPTEDGGVGFADNFGKRLSAPEPIYRLRDAEVACSEGKEKQTAFQLEIDRCRRERVTTAALWKPGHWKIAGAGERRWLQEQFAPIAAALARGIADAE